MPARGREPRCVERPGPSERRLGCRRGARRLPARPLATAARLERGARPRRRGAADRCCADALHAIKRELRAAHAWLDDRGDRGRRARPRRRSRSCGRSPPTRIIALDPREVAVRLRAFEQARTMRSSRAGSTRPKLRAELGRVGRHARLRLRRRSTQTLELAARHARHRRARQRSSASAAGRFPLAFGRCRSARPRAGRTGASLPELQEVVALARAGTSRSRSRSSRLEDAIGATADSATARSRSGGGRLRDARGARSRSSPEAAPASARRSACGSRATARGSPCSTSTRTLPS